jgi:hypothetical protein
MTAIKTDDGINGGKIKKDCQTERAQFSKKIILKN